MERRQMKEQKRNFETINLLSLLSLIPSQIHEASPLPSAIIGAHHYIIFSTIFQSP